MKRTVSGLKFLFIIVKNSLHDVKNKLQSKYRKYCKKGEVMKQSGILQNNLVVLRAEKRWSQTDLANKAGVSRQTIASIEANRYNPSLILALKLHIF